MLSYLQGTQALTQYYNTPMVCLSHSDIVTSSCLSMEVMITGDYLATARAIAENIDLLPKGDRENSNRVMDCRKLRRLGQRISKLRKDTKEATSQGKSEIKAALDGVYAEVDEITSRTKVYARAEPTDKITIIESYKRQGHVASMTGDGVNDAAALQGANIGSS